MELDVSLEQMALIATVATGAGAYFKQRSEIARWRGEVDSRLKAIESDGRVLHDRIDRKEAERDADFKAHDAKLDGMAADMATIKASLASIVSRMDERDRQQQPPH